MDFRQRLKQSRHANGANATEGPEAQLDCAYFAIDRSKNPVCLDLRLPNGARMAIPYSYVTEIRFDAEKGIEIMTQQKRVCILGRQLAKLYEHLLSFKVRFIQSHIGMDMEEDGLIVREILIEESTFQ